MTRQLALSAAVLVIAMVILVPRFSYAVFVWMAIAAVLWGLAWRSCKDGVEARGEGSYLAIKARYYRLAAARLGM